MRHQILTSKLNRSSAHRKSLLRNMATDLLRHEKIQTTDGKARAVRRVVEKMVTLGKQGGLHARRQALTVLFDEKVADKVFRELASRYAERPGGYTRTVKLGQRLGDGANLVQIELVK